MKIRNCCLIVFILLSFTVIVNSKTTGLFIPDRMAVAKEVKLKEELFGPLEIKEGEVLEVGKDYLVIRREGGKTETFIVPADCRVFVNGQQGGILALRPVLPELFFMTRLYIDRSGNLCLVDGWYVGGVVKVASIDYLRRLIIVESVEDRKTYSFRIDPRLKEETYRLVAGTVCFILLDYESEIRRIFIIY